MHEFFFKESALRNHRFLSRIMALAPYLNRFKSAFLVGSAHCGCLLAAGRGQMPLEGIIRILLVDDCEAWRRFVCSALAKQPEYQVLDAVSDRPELVWKARELEPDLIPAGHRSSDVEWN